ncbi:MAG TPA: hypothetical protein VM510_05005 [Caulifigura sp.]|nr:hypothetical protein [Caulifigura sp.]
MWRSFWILLWLMQPSSVTVAADEIPAAVRAWLGRQTWVKDTDGPILSLGEAGQFDDTHIFAPAVTQDESGQYLMLYPGSQGKPGSRWFRLGLATSPDGKAFQKSLRNPVLGFDEEWRSILTPAILRNPDGSLCRENGRIRLFFSSAKLGKSGLHTLHESQSADGITWEPPSNAILENAYASSILKTEKGYEMWYTDVVRRPWLIRHATSLDGRKWQIDDRPAVQLSQSWEAEVVLYPAVVKVKDVYLMWYGSYDNAVRRETTAIGFAASVDGVNWYKHPQNPVLRPDMGREWESNYVGSGSVMRLADGSFRYWYASRKKPPFNNLYFAINTARWAGPAKGDTSAPPAPKKPSALANEAMPMPPKQGDQGIILGGPGDAWIDVLETVDEDNLIVRVWYVPKPAHDGDTTIGEEVTFLDLWMNGLTAAELVKPETRIRKFRANGTKTFGTTCGGRSMIVLELAP